MSKLLLADENFSFLCIPFLQELGHDVKTLNDYGKNDIKFSDEEVLSLATQKERAVITFNHKDFISLHNSGINHAGIISCTQDLDIQRLANNIHQKIINITTLQGQFIRITRA